jgi:hypothetical protein
VAAVMKMTFRDGMATELLRGNYVEDPRGGPLVRQQGATTRGGSPWPTDVT